MNQFDIAQSLLSHRNIAYLVINSQLKIEEMGGRVELLNLLFDPVGKYIWDVVPELVGSEEHLESIIAGDESNLPIRMVNREISEDEVIYVNLANYPYVAQDGSTAGMIHIAEDVTELALLEQAATQQRNELALEHLKAQRENELLIAKNAELTRLDEIKSRFVSIAAHELRSPLSSITGYADMLNDESFGTLNTQQIQFVEVIERSATRLLSITNNLLDVTRVESGQISVIMQPSDASILLEQSVEELHPQIQGKEQQIILDIELETPMVLCDQGRTVQILMNLISNACKYTPEKGTITVQAHLAKEAGFIEFAVQDTGIGISKEDQKQLFDTFFRASNVNQTGASGAGLGLNITRSLVELQGGKIWFKSKKNSGSTFYFTLHSAEETEC